MEESIKPRGIVLINVFNAQGELIDSFTQNNLIVSLGKQTMARLLWSTDYSDRMVKKIGYGTGSVEPSSADDELTGVFSKALDAATFSGTSIIFEFSLGLSEYNGNTITEMGLISDDDTLFSRITRAGIVKTNEVRLEGTWTITF